LNGLDWVGVFSRGGFIGNCTLVLVILGSGVVKESIIFTSTGTPSERVNFYFKVLMERRGRCGK
jgi:hypothetical protein